jgi:hypothetical protein
LKAIPPFPLDHLCWPFRQTHRPGSTSRLSRFHQARLKCSMNMQPWWLEGLLQKIDA